MATMTVRELLGHPRLASAVRVYLNGDEHDDGRLQETVVDVLPQGLRDVLDTPEGAEAIREFLDEATELALTESPVAVRYRDLCATGHPPDRVPGQRAQNVAALDEIAANAAESRATAKPATMREVLRRRGVNESTIDAMGVR